MINAVTEQFSRFVNFAQDRFDAGKTKAIEKKSFVPSKIQTPMSFASAITGILLDNFEDVQKTLGNGSLALGMNASDIARNELHANVGVFDVTGIVNAIKNDAKNQGGEKDYKVDIGV